VRNTRNVKKPKASQCDKIEDGFAQTVQTQHDDEPVRKKWHDFFEIDSPSFISLLLPSSMFAVAITNFFFFYSSASFSFSVQRFIPFVQFVPHTLFHSTCL
jgi:hypothetical protein